MLSYVGASLISSFRSFEAVLAIRTWAIWNRNKIIGIALAARIPSMLVVELVFVNRFLHSLQRASVALQARYYLADKCNRFIDADPPYPGFRGCFNTRAQRSLWQNYTMLTVAEAGMFHWLYYIYLEIYVIIALLILMIISAFRSCQSSSCVSLPSATHYFLQTADRRGNNNELSYIIHRDGGWQFDGS
jgi:hypothetical protein